MIAATMATDIKTEHIIYRKTPVSWHPYLMLARLDRPIGTWLVLIPGWWSLTLASGGLANMSMRGWYYMLLFALGALLMRSAGCIVNDLWDRKLDAAVERTRNRPLAAGTLSVRQAVIFMLALLLASFVILLQFNIPTIALGFLSLALVATYPAMKRITWWPQLFLGFTFNWGALMGWTAINGSLAWPPLLLYAGGICWTLVYDTVYAHQDKEDDAIIGIKSTARLFAGRSKLYVTGFSAAALALFVAAKYAAAGGSGDAFPLFILPLAHIAWQMKHWEPDDPQSCLRIFRSNRVFGWLVLLVFAV